MILPVDSPKAVLSLAGGKGASLSELVRAGAPVPPGFIVTAAAYRAFVTANGLEERIAEIARSVRADEPAHLDAVSRAIRDLFQHGTLPHDLARAILGAYRRLTASVDITAPAAPDGRTEPVASAGAQVHGSSSVAVRSSATAEDLPGASFAGQHETFLNVTGEQALLDAVKACWSSLWSARAIAYRLRQSAEMQAPSLAIVVQRMIPSEVAGTLFTLNPLTGARQVMINAAWGLGSAVVDGRVTPDTLLLDGATGLLERVEISEKSVMTVCHAGGTQEIAVEPQRRRMPALTNEQAAALARLGAAIESHFGAPQDIEWAIVGEQIHILQSRPVTALKSHVQTPTVPALAPADDDWPAVGERPPQPFDLWTQAVVGEGWPGPVSPLMWSGVPVFLGNSIRYALRGLNASYLDEVQWARRFYGRVYYNEGALVHVVSQELGLPNSFVDAALGSRRNVPHENDQRFRPTRLLRRLPFLLRRLSAQMGTGRELEALFPQIDCWTADFDGDRLDHLSDHELWAECMRWVERFQQVINVQSEINGIALTSFSILGRLMIHWFGRQDLAQDLITGLTGVYAAEIGPALWQLAQLIRGLGLADVVVRNDPGAALAELQRTSRAAPVVRELDSFLMRHGHRCPNEGDWLSPRWADAPEQIIQLIRSYLQAGDHVKPDRAAARQRERRERANGWVEANLDPARCTIFRFVLARTQHAVRMRDNGKHYYMKLVLPVRRIMVLFGQRWTTRGWLEQPDDVFFLTIPDLLGTIEAGSPADAGLDLPALVAGRRRAFLHWARVQAPEVIGADAQPAAEEAQAPAGLVLTGTPVSAGEARGVARIILDSQEANQLQPGDILVTRATDPGWTPVFPLVAGLVLEVGGQLSHAAIVAREYGVPAVVNVNQATSRIRDGQVIVVNGTTGYVHLDPAPLDERGPLHRLS